MDRKCTIENNKTKCACTYSSCSRRGICCDCISYHSEKGEIPGCLFPPEAEKTYDRSLAHFLRVHGKKA